MTFRSFHAGLALRRAILVSLIILGICRLAVMAIGASTQLSKDYSIGSITVPFTVCKQSTTWTRPTAEQQAKIWNDSRYIGRNAQNSYEWNHQFLLVPPDSTSIQYHAENEAGLWTEGTFGEKCADPKYRHNEQWVQAWILLHRVRSIQARNGMYTITVGPTPKGFQSIIFKRLAPNMSVRFVDKEGRVLEEVKSED